MLVLLISDNRPNKGSHILIYTVDRFCFFFFQNGIQTPVKYVNVNGTKYIVNGNHRYYAAQKLGIKNIPVQEVSLPYRGYKSIMDLMKTGKQPGFWKYLK